MFELVDQIFYIGAAMMFFFARLFNKHRVFAGIIIIGMGFLSDVFLIGWTFDILLIIALIITVVKLLQAGIQKYSYYQLGLLDKFDFVVASILIIYGGYLGVMFLFGQFLIFAKKDTVIMILALAVGIYLVITEVLRTFMPEVLEGKLTQPPTYLNNNEHKALDGGDPNAPLLENQGDDVMLMEPVAGDPEDNQVDNQVDNQAVNPFMSDEVPADDASEQQPVTSGEIKAVSNSNYSPSATEPNANYHQYDNPDDDSRRLFFRNHLKMFYWIGTIIIIIIIIIFVFSYTRVTSTYDFKDHTAILYDEDQYEAEIYIYKDWEHMNKRNSYGDLEEMFEEYDLTPEEIEALMPRYDEEYLDMMEKVNVDYFLSKEDGILNGEEITVTFTYDEKYFEETLGVDVVNETYSVTIEGLKEPVDENYEVTEADLEQIDVFLDQEYPNNDFQRGEVRFIYYPEDDHIQSDIVVEYTGAYEDDGLLGTKEKDGSKYVVGEIYKQDNNTYIGQEFEVVDEYEVTEEMTEITK